MDHNPANHIMQDSHSHTMFRKLTARRSAFTLVEIMIVVAIIAVLAVVGVPNFLRSRKRTQATNVLEDLRILDFAVDQYALECGKPSNFNPAFADLQAYMKRDTRLYSSGNTDILGNTFGAFTVDATPRVPTVTLSALSDVAPVSFWSPYH